MTSRIGPPRRMSAERGIESPSDATLWSTDVVVLGGGPAGTATALALARVGRTVVILERSRYESVRVGEALPPEVRLPLAELGVWQSFLDGGPAPSPGVAFAWGEPTPRDNDFIINPFGLGWHIDRLRFDMMLARAAEACGVTVLRAARLLSGTRAPTGSWLLRAIVGGRAVPFQARVLVDATGRAASPIRCLGGGRIVHDRLAGLVGFLRADAGAHEGDRRTLVEAVEDGWWYSALLPGGRYVAAFLTDADLLPGGLAARAAFWRARLGQTCLTRTRLRADRANIGLQVVAATTSRMRRIAGAGRVAVGDAAATLDPLSSQGVYRALLSGRAAAHAIDEDLRGAREALSAYARQVEADFQADLQAWADHYGRERRWPDAPFWARRHALADEVRRRSSRRSSENMPL